MDRILILDFGSQFTQLIARRVREIGVYCEIFPANSDLAEIKKFNANALIFSGGPFSVFDKDAPQGDEGLLSLNLPILGICYGMQWISHKLQGKVEPAKVREYGLMEINLLVQDSLLFGAKKKLKTWMSHGDEVRILPEGFREVARSESGALAAIDCPEKKIFALQFHPEVTHTEYGTDLIANFLKAAAVSSNWNLDDFIGEKLEEIRSSVGDTEHAICALSGGVDSTVAATLVEKAIPGRLHCLYIDNGLQREGESEQVMQDFQNTGLSVRMIDAREDFLSPLKGVTDPEVKRKTIGRVFIEVFQREAEKLTKSLNLEKGIEWMVQGTLYPDVIESVPPPGRGGFSSTIKSHHNVGGLPEKMKLKLIEPLRELFKDEVRSMGKILAVPDKILKRHPFPGPGLSIRCLGEVTEERLAVLRSADKIYIDELRARNLYDQIWQAGVILLPLSTVGVMGDSRTYESPVVLRAVVSNDAMTANWYSFTAEDLGEISSRIINEVRGVNRVAYDVSTKPPATIEWE